MKKLVIFICAMVISLGMHAQKDEIKALEKAVKKEDFASAKAALGAAEGMLRNMDDKTKAKFYFLKAQTYYGNGAVSTDDLDPLLEAMNNTKEIEKEMGKLKYTEDINVMRESLYSSYGKMAQDAATKKDNSLAAARFEELYRIKPSDTTMLYYAASYAVNDGDYDTSLKHYEELIELGYTGIAKNYYATRKETGQEEYFSTKENRDLAVMSKEYISPRMEKTKSRQAEITKNVALIYVAQDKPDLALKYMDDARKANPDDLGLLLSEANVHLKMGDKEKFKALMEEATEKDPNNAELQYNLGVLAAEGGDSEAAKKYYEKAISLDPTYTNAYTNMAVEILGGEASIVEEMNSLGTSAADNKRYDELKEERSQLYNSAIPYLEKALELNPKNLNAAQTLMNIFSAQGETDKFKAMRARVEEMEAAAGN